MNQSRFNSFSDFWPHYLSEHGKPATRLLHAAGTFAAAVLLVLFIATGRWWLFPLAFVPGYGLAWTRPFFIEKTRPATFMHPLWSFMGDWKMLGLMQTGTITVEVSRIHNDPR